ncbi:DUF1707 SHOCT-like domain-containing protein [Nonomuraea typhae]|uniref:DUF1707 SHOCT-like domain-containing protein n=1 Tax=Nonomuraea typhae TaxID=2603600 RepID=UPI0012FC3A3F|nr:DUF1707 domain-containing protein [Nonomuraea typhae]
MTRQPIHVQGREPGLRASDAERDRVVDLLHGAVADGRLDPVEFDERLDSALTARTVDALARLTADLITLPGDDGPPAELLTIKERHGLVRRDGRWTLPHRLAVRTAWSEVMLDLTKAVRSAPELVIQLRVNGGTVELVLAPGMVVNANELSVRHSLAAIGRDAGDDTPETLHVRLVGRIRHAQLTTRWQPRLGAT